MNSIKTLRRLVVTLTVLLLTICAASSYMFYTIKKPLLSDAAARKLSNDPLMITLVFALANIGKTLSIAQTNTISGCKEVPLNMKGVKGIVHSCLDQESVITVFIPCYKAEAIIPDYDDRLVNKVLASTKFPSLEEARKQEAEIQKIVGRGTMIVPVQECTFNARVVALPDTQPIPAEAIQAAAAAWATFNR